MSSLAGIYRPEGRAIEEQELISLSGATDRYAPDGTFVRASGPVGMVFQPFHTHERSRLEYRPVSARRVLWNVLELHCTIKMVADES
jgi:asparagine synthase (glutamine-hydrolysing)